jgi:WhiB family redox-sensing transcriptional regulator
MTEPVQSDSSDWMKQAKCRGTYDPRFFGNVADQRAAVEEMCDVCPVITDCLDVKALRDERVGVWGGETSTTKFGYGR